MSAAGKNAWLPTREVALAENGDLLGWRIDGPGTESSELVNAESVLLRLRLLDGENDVSDHISWQRFSPDRDGFGGFTGVHAGLGLTIHRSYYRGTEPGTIVHQVKFSASSKILRGDILAELRLQTMLRGHAPNDGSLGDAFYGFIRVFGASSADATFEPVREPGRSVEAALVARHVAVVISPELSGDQALAVDAAKGITLILDTAEDTASHRQVLGAMELTRGVAEGQRFQSFMYSDMWSPLRGLAKLIEGALQALSAVVGNFGVAIIMFGLLLRAALLPLGLWSIRQQRHFAAIQQQMKPVIENINRTLKGAAKSEEILKTYKDHGISPFSGLKGSVGLFVQLPILIALFAVTTESAMFRDAAFLWVTDLSLPDRTLSLPLSIPGLGSYLNLLPILLGVVCVIAALVQARSSAAQSPRSGLLLALVFVVFFYSCAAALVIYWTVVNVSQIFEGLYVTRTGSN